MTSKCAVEHSTSKLSFCCISSGVLDLDQLCIEEDRFVFKVCVHLTYISIDGNLRDAGVLAVVCLM